MAIGSSLERIRILDLRECPENIETLATWHHTAWAYLHPEKSLEQRISSLGESLTDSIVPSTLVALGDPGLLGSASIIKNDMDTRPGLSPWLACVFVSPPFRRKGIGSLLVGEMVRRTTVGGIEHIYLFTPDRRRFYERLGWKKFDEVVYRGTTVDLMEIFLSHSPISPV